MADQRAQARQLHVLHNLGGGAERWVRDWCSRDRWAHNLVLVPETDPHGATVRLCLYRNLDETAAIREWRMMPPIHSTTDEHRGYRAAMAEIAAAFGIDRLIVSSLIGHSLDALRTGLETIYVCHDYHFLTLGDFPPDVLLVAPSQSVLRNVPAGLRERMRVIPHGVSEQPRPVEHTVDDRLRIVVLGRLTEAKGLRLLDAMADRLVEFADLILLGCGLVEFDRPGVVKVPNYGRDELPALLEKHRPHMGLLLSIVPETFSYTLSELFAAGIPPLATRLGAFEDRIQDDVTGLVCEPDPEDILARIRSSTRDDLLRIHNNLRAELPRSVEAMIADYGLLPPSEAAYFGLPAPSFVPTPMSRIHLYWRTAATAFRQSDRAEAEVPTTDAWHPVQLAIPAGEHASLRLDPGSAPGAVSLRNLVLRDANGAAIWTWNEGPSLFDFETRAGILDLGGVLYMVDDDAHFTLGVTPDALARLSGGGHLEFGVSYPPLSSAIERVLCEKQAEWVEFKAAVARCEADLAAAHMQTAAAHAETAAAHAETAAAREEARAQVARAEAETQAVRESLSWRITQPLRRLAQALYNYSR